MPSLQMNPSDTEGRHHFFLPERWVRYPVTMLSKLPGRRYLKFSASSNQKGEPVAAGNQEPLTEAHELSAEQAK